MEILFAAAYISISVIFIIIASAISLYALGIGITDDSQLYGWTLFVGSWMAITIPYSLTMFIVHIIHQSFK